MADFREIWNGTERQQIANEPLFADHLLSMPPPRPPGAFAWGMRDGETGLMPIWREEGLWFVIEFGPAGQVREYHLFSNPEPSDEDYAHMLHEVVDAESTDALCYFIGADEGPIKIGYALRPHERLKLFQMGCPVPLKLLATRAGGAAREAAYHWQFKEHRAHGEWFNRCPEILAEIERLNQ